MQLYVCIPVWGNYQKKTYTGSLFSWVRSLFKSTRWDSGSLVQEVPFFQTLSTLVFCARLAVCKSVLPRGKRAVALGWEKSANDEGQEFFLPSFHITNISYVKWVLWTCDDLIEDWLFCLESLERSCSNTKYANNVLITILKSVSLLAHSFCITQAPGLALENNVIAEGKNPCGCRP